MSQLDPTTVSIGDLCRASLKECGAIGVGQTPLQEDVDDAWARMQWLLMQWERKRWLVYHLKSYSKVSTGQISYTIGPGGEFDTGPNSIRPPKLSSAFTRQQMDSVNPIDYQLEIMQSMEDYNWIALKNLHAGPGEAVFLDSDWPLANLYVWPIPQAGIYEIHVTVHEQLPFHFLTINDRIILPYEYYAAMMYSLAMRLRPKYRMGTYPGDHLPGMAKDSMAVLRIGGTQVTKLRMPSGLKRGGTYNIFSDRPT